MGTQVPKWLGLSVLAVGTPLILWHASRTNDQLNALDREADASRYETCRDKSHGLGMPMHLAKPFCRCVVSEAEKRGANQRFGGYDEDLLQEVGDYCAAANGFRFADDAEGT